jgi:hypothetical protein
MTSVRIAAVAVIAVFAFSESSTGAILEFHSEHCVVIQLKPTPPFIAGRFGPVGRSNYEHSCFAFSCVCPQS